MTLAFKKDAETNVLDRLSSTNMALKRRAILERPARLADPSDSVGRLILGVAGFQKSCEWQKACNLCKRGASSKKQRTGNGTLQKLSNQMMHGPIILETSLSA